MSYRMLAFIFLSAWLSSGCEEPTWRLVESDTDRGLESIWGSDASDIWAVGRDRNIIRWNGRSWSEYDLEEQFYGDLFSVWGTSSDNVWAAGESGAIFHWDGDSWTRVDDKAHTSRWYYGIWGKHNDEVWVVGCENDESVVSYWNGSTWSDVDGPNLECLKGINGLDSEFIVSVGWANSMHNEGPAVLLWDGATWLETYPECGSCDRSCWFEGVWCLDYDDVWAVGSNYCQESSGHLMHWNGSSRDWEQVKIGHVAELRDVWGESEDNVWAVGTAILHWNGKSWSKESSEAIKYMKAVWGIGGDIWAVGSFGTIVRRRK